MHRANAEFWKEYRALPADIRERADKQFVLLRVAPFEIALKATELVVPGRFFVDRPGAAPPAFGYRRATLFVPKFGRPIWNETDLIERTQF